MVEARGVEPLSENDTGQETTYLVQFKPWAITPQRSPRTLRTDKKRKWLACWSRLESPDVGPKASPLCDVLLQPTDKVVENGYLTN